MKFIDDAQKYNKIKDLAKNGDVEAKNFLFNFMEMTDEDANKYLASISVEDKEIDITGSIEFLIKDEEEAIDGYDRAIKLLTSSNGDKSKIEVLQHIKDEELEHIKELKEIL